MHLLIEVACILKNNLSVKRQNVDVNVPCIVSVGTFQSIRKQEDASDTALRVKKNHLKKKCVKVIDSIQLLHHN